MWPTPSARSSGKAKQLIADGRAEVKAYVASQPAALRQFASEADQKMSGEFDALDSDVNSKQDSVVSDLAQKYVAARESVDASITKMQEEDKGLVDEAEAAVGGAIETILKLKDWIEHTAQRIAGSVDKILADPITFLSKLVNAVGHGFTGFVQNIWTHLEHGFKDYLLGTLDSAGIRIPDELDFKGILMMLADLFGLTWEHIKGRILQKLGPKAEKLWHLIEHGIEFVKIIAEKGLEGIWETLVDKIGDLKEMVIGQIKSFVVTEVIQKGIEWVLSLCNPAGAFVQAVEMIIHVVEFFIDKGKQIQETVDRILDSVESLLSGGEGGVPALIEETLANSIPTVIAFLADLAGLGGIADKIKEMVNSARSLVDKGIDWVVAEVIRLVKSTWAMLTGKADEKSKPDERSDDEKQKALEDGLAEADSLAEQRLSPDEIRPKLPAIKSKYKMAELNLVVDSVTGEEATVHFEAEVNPRGRGQSRNTPSEKLYALTTSTLEVRSELRLVENPADRFPRPIQVKLDTAQKTVYENNKGGGGFGDKSTQFAAIAETINKGALKEGMPMHIEKNPQYGLGLGRYLADADPEYPLPERAKAILIAEKKKCDEAAIFCEEYSKGNAPPLPGWAAEFKDYLIEKGLPADYPIAEPEGPRGRRRR